MLKIAMSFEAYRAFTTSCVNDYDILGNKMK